MNRKLKFFISIVLLVFVFFVVAEVSEFVIASIPGTPNYRLQQELSTRHQLEMWLGRPQAESIIRSASIVKLLAILPFAGFVTGIVGSLLVVPRKKVAVLTSIMYVFVAIIGYLASVALYKMLIIIQCVDTEPLSHFGYSSYVGIMFIFAGCVICSVAACMGHLLGKLFNNGRLNEHLECLLL